MSDRGVITTFYSYKGGTGRTMALANVAWILASNGKRVLVLDWDLEAPGLHTYFAPFLKNSHVRENPGLMDWIYEYLVAVTEPGEEGEGTDWIDDYAALDRFAVPIEWEFRGLGCLHLVSAGRQDSRYAGRVNRFDWQRFYEVQGGGAFIDRALNELRLHYDHILIDSRTGVSDTSGICTVQAPDQLVVLFTLNNQSIEGASEVVRNILVDRSNRAVEGRNVAENPPATKESQFKVIPVMTRVELAEDDRLKARQALARERFGGFIGRNDVVSYLGKLQVQYVPYYAYEEVLAAVRELPEGSHPMLASFLALAGEVSSGAVTALPEVTDAKREGALAAYANVQAAAALAGGGHLAAKATVSAEPIYAAQRWDVFISYPLALTEQAKGLYLGLIDRCNAFMAPRSIPAGAKSEEYVDRALKECRVHVILIDRPMPRLDGRYAYEIESSLARKAADDAFVLTPLLVDGAAIPAAPFLSALREYQATNLRPGGERRVANKILKVLGLTADGEMSTIHERAVLAEVQAKRASEGLESLRRRTLSFIGALLVVIISAWLLQRRDEQAREVRQRELAKAALVAQAESLRKTQEAAEKRVALKARVANLAVDLASLSESVAALQSSRPLTEEQIALILPLLDDASSQSKELASRIEELRAPVLTESPDLASQLSEASSSLSAIDTTILQIANTRAADKPTTRTAWSRARDVWEQGYAKASIGDFEGAAKDYRRARDIDPSFAPAINSLGVNALRQGDLDTASKLFDQAIAAEPDYPPPYVNQAIVYQRNDQVDRAREFARVALAKQPGYGPAVRFLADMEKASLEPGSHSKDPMKQGPPQ